MRFQNGISKFRINSVNNPTVSPYPERMVALRYQDIEPDYFGWRADDDEVQLLEESQRELELQLEAEEEYRRTHGISPHKRGRTASSGSASSATAAVAQPTPSSPSRRQATAAAYKSFVSVPTEGEIDKLILAKKKQLLVQQYVSDKDKEQQKETEDMLSTSKGGA